MNADELSVKAEAFALRGSGRSARTAKQFVNQLVNEQ
jgi:predicted AAA+ superfamily ATPase